MVRSLEQLIAVQTFPVRDVILLQTSMSCTPVNAWQQAKRVEQFKALLADRVLPVFTERDAERRGRARFTVVLTYVPS